MSTGTERLCSHCLRAVSALSAVYHKTRTNVRLFCLLSEAFVGRVTAREIRRVRPACATNLQMCMLFTPQVSTQKSIHVYGKLIHK